MNIYVIEKKAYISKVVEEKIVNFKIEPLIFRNECW